ncbi:putative alanine aminotransferase [Bienertia sinuspersici]
MGTKMYSVVTKLKNLKQKLRKLNSEGFCDVKAAAILAQQKVKNIQDDLMANPLDHQLLQLEKEALENARVTHQNHISFLRQKSKLLWLAQGDEYSTVFYQSLKTRRAQNRINSIHTDDDKWINTHEGVEQAFLNQGESSYCGSGT